MTNVFIYPFVHVVNRLSAYHVPGAVLTPRTKGIRKGPCLCRTSLCLVQRVGGRQNMNEQVGFQVVSILKNNMESWDRVRR